MVVLDGKGRLILFRIRPSEVLSHNKNTVPFDWEIFFNEAGLDYLQWDFSDLQRNPVVYADILKAWQPSASCIPR